LNTRLGPVRRSWFVAAVVLGIAAIAIAVLAARLTDDESGSLDTNEWASSVCSNLADWRGAITDLAEVEGELTPESLEERLGEANAATDELVEDLQALGPPDVEAREEVEQALDDTAEGLRESYESLRVSAEQALAADSPTAFLQELAALAPEFQALVQQVEDTVASLQSASLFGEASAELEDAFADADSCDQLRDEG
jgi:hypothetical protein